MHHNGRSRSGSPSPHDGGIVVAPLEAFEQRSTAWDRISIGGEDEHRITLELRKGEGRHERELYVSGRAQSTHGLVNPCVGLSCATHGYLIGDLLVVPTDACGFECAISYQSGELSFPSSFVSLTTPVPSACIFTMS